MWRIGLMDDDSQEQKTVETLIRHGNFDWVTESETWEENESNRRLPASLYLSEKPAFMGDTPWPWVDPETGATAVLPAKRRFDRIRGI